MGSLSREVVAEQLTLADALREGRDSMLVPQDLPGRYGRVVKALDHVLDAAQCMAALGGGWAVWRHGYLGRVTQDIDIVLPADKVDTALGRRCTWPFAPRTSAFSRRGCEKIGGDEPPLSRRPEFFRKPV